MLNIPPHQLDANAQPWQMSGLPATTESHNKQTQSRHQKKASEPLLWAGHLEYILPRATTATEPSPKIHASYRARQAQYAAELLWKAWSSECCHCLPAYVFCKDQQIFLLQYCANRKLTVLFPFLRGKNILNSLSFTSVILLCINNPQWQLLSPFFVVCRCTCTAFSVNLSYMRTSRSQCDHGAFTLSLSYSSTGKSCQLQGQVIVLLPFTRAFSLPLIRLKKPSEMVMTVSQLGTTVNYTCGAQQLRPQYSSESVLAKRKLPIS